MFLSLPATAALLISSEEITSALFGYGSFDIFSVKNSANALFYFALGLPAFALIKVFSSFLFARHNTKIPFYFSFLSVVINISISVYFFDKIGFIIIPIATTISSWFNSLILFMYLVFKKYFLFNRNFFSSFIKIIMTTFLTTYIFYHLVNFFENYLIYESNYKLITIILLVIVTFILYILLSIVTKAFKISDIKLKY